MRRFSVSAAARAAAVLVAASLGGAAPASAHPHVWVTVKSELVYAPDGTLNAVRQDWTFDDAFSAYALQGLDQKPDGSYGDDVLKPLAQVNVDSLKEYGYFTKGKTAIKAFAFKDPVDYYLTHADDRLTLHFTLPVEKPVKGSVSVDVYDPTYFISFAFDETNPVALKDAPAGCTMSVTAPAPPTQTTLNESFFSQLTGASDYGAQFANKIAVKCP